MSFSLVAPVTEYQPDSGVGTQNRHSSSTTTVRNSVLNALHYSHVQEIQRERLRQAESDRLRRLALRARRAVVSQIVR